MRNIKLFLLFTFFVVTSCAQPPNRATTGALAGGALGAGLGAIVGNQAGHHAGEGVAIGAAAGALGGALIGNALDSQANEREALQEKISRQEEQIAENRKLIDALRRRGADVRDSKRGVVINLPDILFRFDRYDLTPEAHRTIREISEVLRDVHGRHIAVEGHTDSVGGVDYNLRLSENRAQSVSRELERNGISSRDLSDRGFGEGQPIATNNTDAGRARNRRVEVIVENR